jgi:taurine transport system substrate-binding protein
VPLLPSKAWAAGRSAPWIDEAADVPGVLALYNFPTLEEQTSCAWLGCGADGGAVKALIYTSEFLKKEKKIPDVLADYTPFVTPQFVEAAMALK